MMQSRFRTYGMFFDHRIGNRSTAPVNLSNSMVQEFDVGSHITSSHDIECFSFPKDEIQTQEGFAQIDSHHILGVLYDSMQACLSSNKARHDIGLQIQVHESQPRKPCKSIQNTTFNATSKLYPFSKTPIDLAHPPDGNLKYFDDPLPKLEFENKSVSSSMYEGEKMSSIAFPKHTYENIEQSQQVACNMETNASPSLNANQKAHNQQFYQSPLTHRELDLGKLHNNVRPISIDESYSLFKTKPFGSGGETLDVRRYFSALKGLELETIKDSECSVLPMDRKWPFLLRFPIGCFGINLGLGSQAILWKTLAYNQDYMQVPTHINLVLWCVATVTLTIIFTIYAIKVVFYFEAVRREFNHPVRINFFFAPWIACMLLALGVPPQIDHVSIHSNIWILVFMAPIFALNLKVYGDWLSGGKRHLCKVANPSTHLSLMGNFVGALLLATFGYMELALFFWSVGFLHYLVLLVTLYQRLPSATVLPKELHPIFFLFVSIPSSASVSWAKIMGKFDLVAKIIYFLAMFLFFSLVTKSKIFSGFRFNIAWWAYTFPLTVSAIGTIQYSLEVEHPLTQTLAALLTITSSITVMGLAITTMLHTFVWKSMFPNDMAIAITSKGTETKKNIKEIQEDILPLQGLTMV